MKIFFHKRFVKDSKKLDQKIQIAVDNCLKVFCTNPYHIKLNNHPLKGKWQGYRSINISGDIRAVYKEINEDEVIFVAIGSHSELYG